MRATRQDKHTSIILIGFALWIGTAVWSFSHETLMVKGMAVIATLWLLASMAAGAYGMLREFKGGNNNPFDLQAKFGIVAVIFFSGMVIFS